MSNTSNKASWIASANDGLTDFPIQNLPYGVFGEPKRIGVAIGREILDLRLCAAAGLFDDLKEIQAAVGEDSLNALMALGPSYWQALRQRLTELLESSVSAELRHKIEPNLTPQAGARMHLPARIGDYTDFFTSRDHALNVGRLFRPDHPLHANYRYLPIAYHGRASSIVVSGTPVRRPHGQSKGGLWGPSCALDYELEAAFFIGPGNALGQPISMDQSEAHIFGFCLLNDWSARDIQAWESTPLGPFLGKSFATSISPWIVSLAALEHFRVPAFERDEAPAPLPYLRSSANQQRGAIDINLEAHFSSALMRQSGIPPVRLSHSNFRRLYWTSAQMVAHHTSNGCNLRPGDLIGSGTVSGPEPGNRGCLLEITRGGAEPVHLPNGEQRTYLEDGDEIILAGYCQRDGHPRIGFGQCGGVIVA